MKLSEWQSSKERGDGHLSIVLGPQGSNDESIDRIAAQSPQVAHHDTSTARCSPPGDCSAHARAQHRDQQAQCDQSRRHWNWPNRGHLNVNEHGPAQVHENDPRDAHDNAEPRKQLRAAEHATQRGRARRHSNMRRNLTMCSVWHLSRPAERTIDQRRAPASGTCLRTLPDDTANGIDESGFIGSRTGR